MHRMREKVKRLYGFYGVAAGKLRYVAGLCSRVAAYIKNVFERPPGQGAPHTWVQPLSRRVNNGYTCFSFLDRLVP